MIFMILRLLFIIASNLYCIPAYFAWMLFILPLRTLIPRLYDAIEATLFSWLLTIVSSWIWLGNVTVEEAGDDLNELLDKKCVVICNHQSTSDVPLLIYYLTSKPRVARTLSWIMDIMFKYSHFGLVSQVHRDYFIKQGRDTRDEQLLKLKRFLVRDFSRLRRNWLMLFPEGGFLYKRLMNSQKYASRHGYVHLDYCTLPRTGAIECVLDTLVQRPNRMVTQNTDSTNQQGNNNTANIRNDTQQHDVGEEFEQNLENILREGLAIEWVIDLTICYPKANALSIFDLLTQNSPFKAPLKIFILCRKFPISEVSGMTSDQLKIWLYSRWAEKDEMLRKFYETGEAYLPDPSSYLSSDNRPTKQTQAQLPKSKDVNAPNGLHPSSAVASPETKEMDDDDVDVGSLAPPKISMTIKTSRPVPVSWKKFVFLHCFFIASSCFHYYICHYSMSQSFLYFQSFVLRHPYLVEFLVDILF